MMPTNEPILTEEESIFSRYIALAGNPLLPVTPETALVRHCALGIFISPQK